MARELIITNGDVVAGLLRQAGLGDEILPWRDILYEGPVPHNLPLSELSAVRADYLASRGYGNWQVIARDFKRRDTAIAGHARFDVVTLWFEHDLTDMLQLLQVLDHFAVDKRDRQSLRIVHADHYLGRESPARFRRLAAQSTPVGQARLNAAREAWARWREPDPRPWAALLNRPRLGLKHLWSGVLASLDLLPRDVTGLDGVETFVLDCLANEALTTRGLFSAFCASCDSSSGTYMGDLSFFAVLDRLAGGPAPLIAGLDGGPFDAGMTAAARKAYLGSRPALTLLGHGVMAGRKDWARHTRVDRWLGGTHITNRALWRYDAEAGRVISPRRR